MRAPAILLAAGLVAAFAAAACGNGPEASDDAPANAGGAPSGSNDPHDPAMEQLPDPLAGLPKGKEQLAKVCAHGQRDAVTKALCGGRSIGSIVELEEALGLGFDDRSEDGLNGAKGNPAFALLGHSMSLVSRSVSAINPRAFVFTAPPGAPTRLPGFVILGFARGEPFVEIAADDPNQRKLTFYLLRFELACEEKGSCGPADLLTPATEKDWQGFSLYDDEDLKNTIVDCRECHQPKGPGSRPMLRMQELADPWTHWFRNDRPGGQALLEDFTAAHGDREDYGGIPGALIPLADGRAMEDFVTGQGFGDQPNEFDAKQIEQEVSRAEDGQPEVNVPAGESRTWQEIYDAASQGDFIPVPYHDVKVTDPQKLAFATSAYKAFMDGGPASALTDIRRVFLDAALPDMTMRPKPGATGEEILVQMCSQCHNGRLDPSLSRARFDATNLSGMSAAVKQSAISRMKLPATDLRHMPPAMFRTIPDDQLALAVAELSK
jgi:hypothetical protein